MAVTTINYLSLTGLNQYDTKIKAFINEQIEDGVANSFKYVNLVDGVLKFYTVNPIAEDTAADFEITLPEQDLSHLMALVKDATKGNIASFGDGGQVVDSGIKATDIATKEEVETVQNAVDTLDAYVGDIPEGYEERTIIGYINKVAEETLNSASGGSTESAASVLQALNTYKTENNAKVQANSDAIAVLNGGETVEGSVDKKIADAINVFATQMTDNNTIDTFKEIVNYISTHGTEAGEMMTAIDQLEKLVGDTAVATQIANAIAAENLDQYATDEELAEAIARIVVVEGKAHEHTNATILNGITSEKVAAWDASEGNAIGHADTEIAKVNAKIGEVAEGKTVVQLIQEAREAAIASAEEKGVQILASAKSYTDEKFGAIDLSGIETNATAITELQGDVAELQSVQHVEISEEEINQMFQ